MQQTENSAYLRGSMWDFKGRKGEVYFLLFLLPIVWLFPPATRMYWFLYMNKNIKIFKNPVECSCPEAAAISEAVCHYSVHFFYTRKG